MGRLCQGIGTGPDGAGKNIKVTDTLHVIDYKNIPMDHRKEITYTKFVCLVCPKKSDPNHTRITIGGNHIC